MKKFLILILFLCLFVTGCGNKNEDDKDNTVKTEEKKGGYSNNGEEEYHIDIPATPADLEPQPYTPEAPKKSE